MNRVIYFYEICVQVQLHINPFRHELETSTGFVSTVTAINKLCLRLYGEEFDVLRYKYIFTKFHLNVFKLSSSLYSCSLSKTREGLKDFSRRNTKITEIKPYIKTNIKST